MASEIMPNFYHKWFRKHKEAKTNRTPDRIWVYNKQDSTCFATIVFVITYSKYGQI